MRSSRRAPWTCCFASLFRSEAGAAFKPQSSLFVVFFNIKTYILARFWDPAASFLASLAFYACSLLRQAFTRPVPSA